MEVFQSYIAEGGLIRLILIGAFVYYYSKQNKRMAELSAKIDFLNQEWMTYKANSTKNKMRW